MWKCETCGKSNDRKSVLCAVCGEWAPDAHERLTRMTRPRGISKRQAILIVAVLFLLAIAGLITYFIMYSGLMAGSK